MLFQLHKSSFEHVQMYMFWKILNLLKYIYEIVYIKKVTIWWAMGDSLMY